MADRQQRRDAGGISRNGLRVDRAKLAAWQRRAAENYAAKQRARSNAARLTSRIDRPRPTPRNDWSRGVRQLAGLRSGGICELCGTEPAVHLHHRKLRRHGDHRIVNALHVCHGCHAAVHNAGLLAVESGRLVRSQDDPAVVAVELAGRRLVQLLDDGTYLNLAA